MWLNRLLVRRHPCRKNRRCIAHDRLPRIAAVAACIQRAFAFDACIEAVPSRTIAHATEERLRIARMAQQHPRHPGIFFLQSLSRDAPIFAGVVAKQDTPMRMGSLSAPNPRRTSTAAQHHAWRIPREKMPFV